MNEKYMQTALDLAVKGCGFVNPNPMVGAVVVKNGEIIGCGYHQKYGEPHAERNALKSCVQSPKGATLYVTLEPCCHYGKTPPCTEAIIESGIDTVVIGSRDPNPLVAGKGIEVLKSHGINVVVGILEEECLKLNEIFFYYIQKKAPFAAIKYAMTMDGKIATSAGESKWITGEKAREHVHMLRNQYASIMVGVQTVIADDPLLNCRIENGASPTRIICDTNLRIPVNSNMIRTAKEIPTLIAHSCENTEKVQYFSDLGCKIIKVEKKDGKICLNRLFDKLYAEKIDSVLIEGGAEINYSAIKSGIVSKAYVYIAPKMIGGVSAKTPVGGMGISRLSDAVCFSAPKIKFLGEDVLLEYDLR